MSVTRLAARERVFVWLNALGIVLSFISLRHHMAPGLGMSFCKIGAAFNCEAVIRSQYGAIGGIPTAAIGGAYFTFVMLLWAAAKKDGFAWFNSARLVMTIFGVLASIALGLISHFIIKAYCIFCMGVYVVNICMFIVALKSYATEHGALFSVPKGTILKGLFAAVVWLVLMLILHEPKKVEWRDFPNQEIENQLSIWRGAGRDDLVPNPQGDLSLGAGSGAKVEIVEFFDYECPACQMFSGAVKELVSKYGGDVRVVLRQYPLDRACNPAIEMDMHKNACRAAEVARCAGRYGVLNVVHEALMTSGVTKEEPTVMFDRAMEIAGVSSDVKSAIAGCVERGEERVSVAADIQLGDKLGIQGTPAFWVNGKKLAAPSIALLDAIIKSELGK